MYLTIRAFYRYSQHAETKPFRWQAARAQAFHDLLKGVLYLEFVPKLALWLLLAPFSWLHTALSEHQLFPGDWLYRRFKPWYDGEVRRLNPIYVEAVRPKLLQLHDPTKPNPPVPVRYSADSDDSW
jgi:hypothetical protein